MSILTAPNVPNVARRAVRRTATANERIIYDTFGITTIAAGSSQFSNHGPEVGQGYIQHPQYTTRTFAMDTSGPGRVYPTGGTTSTACWYAVPMPPHADIDVSGWFQRLTVAANETPGVAARVHPTANTMLVGRYNAATGNVEMIELTAGVATQTVTAAVGAWAGASAEHKITLRCRGALVSVLFDDVEAVAPTTVALTGNNYVAIRLGLGAATGSTTGFHLRTFEAVDYGGLGASAGSEPGPSHSRLVKRTPLPARLNQRNALNSQAFSQSNLVTYNGNQYALWVDAQRRPWISKRSLPSGSWTSTDLSIVSGNPLDTKTLEDTHNTYSIGIGSDGYIHVSGNHHDVALNYIRSSSPEDISAWTTSGSPTSGLTSLITYPQFLKLPSGNLLLFTRNGVSGNGDMRVAKWNSTTHAWGAAVKFIDGAPTSESPYINRPAVGPGGTIHIFYCWRASAGGGNDNQDICHIKSADEGATWTDMAGTGIALPVVHSTSPLITDTASSGSGLLNQSGAAVDAADIPHAAFFLYDGSTKTQVYHVYWDGAAWQSTAVTAWTYKHDLNVGVVDAVVARPQVFCPNDGTTWLLLRHNVNDAGRFYALNVTAGASSSTQRTIWTSPSYYHEATVDDLALLTRSELHVLMAPASPVSNSNTDSTVVRWQDVGGWVLSVPVSDLTSLPST